MIKLFITGLSQDCANKDCKIILYSL